MANNNNNNNSNNSSLNFGFEIMEDTPKKSSVKSFVTNIWGRVKNKKEQDLTFGTTLIGKYWICAQTIYFGIRPTKAKMYNTKEEAQKVFVKLHDLNVEGDFVIAKDIETGKFFIKAQ